MRTAFLSLQVLGAVRNIFTNEGHRLSPGSVEFVDEAVETADIRNKSLLSVAVEFPRNWWRCRNAMISSL